MASEWWMGAATTPCLACLSTKDAGFAAMLWLRKGLGFAGDWTVNDHNDLLAPLFGLQKVNRA